MRQIGVRDEAKMLGGDGVSGRPLCCATFLTEFVPASVRMAKDQGRALNPSRISGVCGRLKCCLAYEAPGYKAIRDELPRVGDMYMTAEGPGRVTDVTVVGEAFAVELEETGKRLFLRGTECRGGANFTAKWWLWERAAARRMVGMNHRSSKGVDHACNTFGVREAGA